MGTINWQKGTWQADGAGDVIEARIMVTADWAPLTNAESNTEEWIAADPESIYGDLMPMLRRADLTITNVECALGGKGEKIWKAGPNIPGSAGALAGLTSVPFDVACLANNHVFDFGLDGYLETVRLLTSGGMRCVGAGQNEDEATRTLVGNVKGTTVGIINFCEGEDCTDARGDRAGTFGWDLNRVVERVQACRQEADVTLVVCHAGREHPPAPPPYIVETYRRIAGAGADAIVAHHPHVPQGAEVHRGVPIIYSMGNFIFYDKSPNFFRKSGYMTELHLAGGRLSGLRLVPYLHAPGGLKLVEGKLLDWFLDRLRRVSEPIADAEKIDALWGAFIERRKETQFIPLLKVFLDNWEAEDKRLGAARFRNLFVPPAQSQLWIDGMTRYADDVWGTCPDWAYEMVEEWTTLLVEDGMAMPD